MDELTGLRNREGLKAELQKQIKRYQRTKRSYCVLLLDLDRFREINQQFGHSMGDYLLRQIGIILENETRISDTVGRIGGDEFGIILPQSQDDDAYKVARRVLENVEQTLQNTPDGDELQITCTIGIHCIDKHYERPEEVLKGADKALSQGKQSNDNCIIREDE